MKIVVTLALLSFFVILIIFSVLRKSQQSPKGGALVPVKAVTITGRDSKRNNDSAHEVKGSKSRISASHFESMLIELQQEGTSFESVSKIRQIAWFLDADTFGRGIEVASLIDSPLLRKEYINALWARARSLGAESMEMMLESFPNLATAQWHREAAIDFSRLDLKRGLDYAKENLLGHEFNNTIGRVFQQKAGTSPENAANDLSLLESGPAKDLAVKFVAIEWSKRDLQNSVQWAQGLPDSDERIAAFDIIARQWGYLDPHASLAYANNLPDGSPERAVFINNSIGSWSGYAPEEAIGWLVDQGLAESEESDYFRMILRVWSYNDPPAAFSYLSSAQAYNLTSRAFKEELDGIFGSWARKDPEQAVNASIMIPEGRAAETAFLISYSNWLDSSPMSAANWAGALPGGDLKDRSIKLLIPKIRETGVKLAWAEKINSDKTRIEICQKIVGTQSEEAVVEILNDNELKLDSQFKAEIINLLINRGH